jgi:hypothetical protein
MIPIMAGSIYIMDRAYLDYQRLYHLHKVVVVLSFEPKRICSFIENPPLRSIERPGLQCDQIIRLTGPIQTTLPGILRRVRLIDPKTIKILSCLPISPTATPNRSQTITKAGGRLNCSSNGSNKTSNQGVLWAKHQCRQNPDLDGHLHLFDHDNFP